MKKLSLLAIVAASGGSTLLTTGCVDLKSAYPEKRYYSIEADRTGPARSAADGTVLRVRRFSASRSAEGSEFVSRTGDGEYESDFYNAFFIPPAAQLTEQARRWLSRSRLFGTVVATGSSMPETHVLEGNLVALHADRRNREAPKAVLEAQFLVVAVKSDPSSVILEKTYREEASIAKDDADSLVRGWREALSKILAALEEDVSKVERSTRK